MLLLFYNFFFVIRRKDSIACGGLLRETDDHNYRRKIHIEFKVRNVCHWSPLPPFWNDNQQTKTVIPRFFSYIFNNFCVTKKIQNVTIEDIESHHMTTNLSSKFQCDYSRLNSHDIDRHTFGNVWGISYTWTELNKFQNSDKQEKSFFRDLFDSMDDL